MFLSVEVLETFDSKAMMFYIQTKYFSNFKHNSTSLLSVLPLVWIDGLTLGETPVLRLCHRFGGDK